MSNLKEIMSKKVSKTPSIETNIHTREKSHGVDMTSRLEAGNWSTYLPALGPFFERGIGKVLLDPASIPPDRMPAGFENGIKGIDPLDRKNGYFTYEYALYSAGHSEWNLNKAHNVEPFIQNRDRKNTTLVGDSGGFQVAKNTMKVDWDNFKGPSGDKLRQDILSWLEYTTDWAMTFDIPAFAKVGKPDAVGKSQFEYNLDLSVHNLHYFAKNRVPGKTKFLNVLSGTSPETARAWYDEVKGFSEDSSMQEMGYSKDRTFEGFAFAGINTKNMFVTLERILSLRQDNLLHDKDWIHVLGVGRLDWSCYLTSIKRQLQKHDNPNINISFDAASPFVATAYGLSYTYNTFSSKRLTYSMDRAINDRNFKGSKLAMPFQSPIMDRLTVGDVCYLGPNDVNKNGKISKTSWDTFSYLLYMSHNVYNHIQAVQETNRLADIEYVRYPNVSYKDWHKQKKSSSRQEISLFIPSDILFFNDFAEKLLDPANKDPMQMLHDNRAFLESISFGGMKGNAFDDMFDVSDTIPSDDEMADMNNEKLDELDNLE
jgi:hypothetical protein